MQLSRCKEIVRMAKALRERGGKNRELSWEILMRLCFQEHFILS